MRGRVASPPEGRASLSDEEKRAKNLERKCKRPISRKKSGGSGGRRLRGASLIMLATCFETRLKIVISVALCKQWCRRGATHLSIFGQLPNLEAGPAEF